jgi:thiamine-phosphate pyrophosphorylase
MSKRQTLPAVWLISDRRNDTVLEHVLMRLPRGSGFIFRHYHLPPAARRARFDALAKIARSRQHLVALSSDAATARSWGADAAYGPPRLLAKGPATLRLITAHSLREIAQAKRARADAVLLSPVFPTRSHPGGKPLGPLLFRMLAARSKVPVIALGGMNRHRARRIGAANWAAIDSFCGETSRLIRKDS